MSKTTIIDIAKKLGIAPSTVSRAFADSSLVKESTKQLILETAKKMNYSKNMAASNLRTGEVNIVGIIVPRIDRHFFSQIISSAEAILDKAGYSVLICQTHEQFEKEITSIKTLIRHRVAGIFISHSIQSQNGEHLLKIKDENIELIQFDRVFFDIPGCKVVNDNYNGAYLATTHLIEQGYEKIGHIAGYMNSQVYTERLKGYKQALIDAGRKIDDNIIFYDSIIQSTGKRDCQKAIELGCDALYSAGDFSALGAIQAAQEQGLKIPEDFGIIGTANEDFTNYISPTMSSLALCPKKIGQKMANAFLEKEKKKNTEIATNEIVTVKIELIKRNSSKKLGD